MKFIVKVAPQAVVWVITLVASLVSFGYLIGNNPAFIGPFL